MSFQTKAVKNINYVANEKLKFQTFEIGDHGIVDYTIKNYTRGDYNFLKFQDTFIKQAHETLEDNFRGHNMEFSFCLVVTQDYSNYERVNYDNYWEHYLQ